MTIKRLERDFFNRATLLVAEELLGKQLVFQGKCGLITETEAYIGKSDPASHAYRGLTPRTRVMFGPPGHAYVYFIYGMYYCLNFVTEPEGTPAGVLIRGLYLLDPPHHLNGPGKLCRYLGITKDHNETDLIKSEDFYVTSSPYTFPFEITPRIGIKVATENLWRFVVKEDHLKNLQIS